MKRGLILQVRESEDKQTKEMLVWVTVGCIPAKMKDGRLYYPRSTDILITTCTGANRDPDKFKKYKSLKVGSIVDVRSAINDFNDKPFISDIIVVKSSAYNDSDLYDKNSGQ